MEKTTTLKETVDYRFDHLESDLKNWPIYKLSERRADFVEELNNLTIENLLRDLDVVGIQELIAKTIYLEKIRMRKTPWKVDPPNEKLFWRRIEEKLTQIKTLPIELAGDKSKELLYKVVNRYSEEIVGSFKIQTFKFARIALTIFFKILFNRFWENIPFWGRRKSLLDKIKLTGHVPEVRKLMDKGTVVLLPTHSSNLDSIFIGYAIDFKAGLPSFCYGAGLNLYNSEFAAYFMNRLGAYRLDRRKKNRVYLETLKTMSRRMTTKGVNNLFFPGGTRSRSGALETKVKMGLLGTLIEAQRKLIETGSDKKVFVVPVILSYPFVLEARVMIDEYLRQEGKEKYFKRKYKKVKRFSKLTFFNHLFSKRQTTWVSFGQPMDVLGNAVDSDGNSKDSKGYPIQVKDYFAVGEVIRRDLQRESVYTKKLSDSVLDSYKKDNVVLTAQFAAYCAFKYLERLESDKDIYDLFLLEETDVRLPIKKFTAFSELILERLKNLEKNNGVKLTPEFNLSIEKIIQNGISELGHYSVRNPLKINYKKGYISTEDVKLLYFYHNRLNVYDEQLFAEKISFAEFI